MVLLCRMTGTPSCSVWTKVCWPMSSGQEERWPTAWAPAVCSLMHGAERTFPSTTSAPLSCCSVMFSTKQPWTVIINVRFGVFQGAWPSGTSWVGVRSFCWFWWDTSDDCRDATTWPSCRPVGSVDDLSEEKWSVVWVNSEESEHRAAGILQFLWAVRTKRWIFYQQQGKSSTCLTVISYWWQTEFLNVQHFC